MIFVTGSKNITILCSVKNH